MTAAGLAPAATVEIDPRLWELDYGEAEGLTFSQLAQRFPEFPAAWRRAEDPRFPQGENTADVARRLQAVLASLGTTPTLVVTHNVVMRCLLGTGLNLPLHRWHLIPVEHLEIVPVLQLNGQTYLDLSSEQKARITDALIRPF